MKIVILYSGGLDSMMMEKLAKYQYPDAEIIKIFFKHGQESEAMELSHLPEDVIIRNVDWLDENVKAVSKLSDPMAGNIYIPGRNLIFACLAACQYLPDEIWLGVLDDECNNQATDKNREFQRLTNDVLSYVLSPFTKTTKLIFPFVDREFTKTKSLKYLLDNKLISHNDIKKTTSCWFNYNKPCGSCKQCLKRALILNQFDIIEEHEGMHPLNKDNLITKELINLYKTTKNPNKDEIEMLRLINLFEN